MSTPSAERSARYRAKGKTITVVLDPETYELLCKLQQQMERSRAETITAALRALAPRKASREFSDAEIDAIFADIEAKAAAARRLRSGDAA